MSLDYYTALLTDRPRIEAFREAILAEVKPGDRVLDVGSGLGTYAFFAAEAGAEKVWAVESGPVAHLASLLATANGLDDRVEFIRGKMPDVEAPEPVDVLIFEDYPIRLLDHRTHGLLTAFKERFLKPDGRLVPGLARLWLAPAAGRELSMELDPEAAEAFGIDWSVMFPYVVNGPRYVRVARDRVLAPPQVGSELTLLDPPEAASLAIDAEWTFDEPATVEALLYWFEIRLGDRWLSNAPGEESVWGQVSLPLHPAIQIPRGCTEGSGRTR